MMSGRRGSGSVLIAIGALGQLRTPESHRCVDRRGASSARPGASRRGRRCLSTKAPRSRKRSETSLGGWDTVCVRIKQDATGASEGIGRRDPTFAKMEHDARAVHGIGFLPVGRHDLTGRRSEVTTTWRYAIYRNDEAVPETAARSQDDLG